VYDLDGNVHQIRALLDSGSQVNLITENLCKKLKLKRRMANFSITGVGQTVTNVTNTAQIKIFSNHSQYSSVLSCFILNTKNYCKLTHHAHLVNVKIPPTYNLADPNSVINCLSVVLGIAMSRTNKIRAQSTNSTKYATWMGNKRNSTVHRSTYFPEL
jgi:hypothetical protein